MKKLFINLTNGIEYLKGNDIPADVSFIRIQSTYCEQKHWNSVFEDLDNNFLMNLALGTNCVVVDYGSRSDNGQSRAMSHGIPMILYVLNRLWLDKDTKPMIKGMNVHDYFSQVYDDLMNIRPLKAKLSYFKKFINTDRLHIIVQSQKTAMDGKYEEYAEILKDWHVEQSEIEKLEIEVNDAWIESHQDRLDVKCSNCRFLPIYQSHHFLLHNFTENGCIDCERYSLWERK
jgi:hypothetical protein